MKVLITCSHVNPNTRTGVHVYTLRLVESLCMIMPTADIVLSATPQNIDYLKSVFPRHRICCVTDRVPAALRVHQGFFRSLFREKQLHRIVERDGIGCVIYLWFTERTKLIRSSKASNLAVLHDLQQFSLEKNGVLSVLMRLLFARNIRGVDRMIAISSASREVFLSRFAFPSDRIDVIPNGVPHVSGARPADLPAGRYVLSVNAMVPYKNFECLIKAFALAADKIPHHLVIKSSDNRHWRHDLLPLIRRLGLQDRVSLNSDVLSEAGMAALYANADLFVSLSTMEGFGYSPVEAAIQRVPVLCSDIPAIREVTKGLCHYVSDPHDCREAADKMVSILRSRERQGREREEIATTLIEAYSLESQAAQFKSVLDTIQADRQKARPGS